MAGKLELPLVDLSSPDTADTARTIRQACLDCGFFYLINHGIDKELLDRLFLESGRFFSLPLGEKMKLEHNSDHRGYTPMYAEKLDPSSGFQGRFPYHGRSYFGFPAVLCRCRKSYMLQCGPKCQTTSRHGHSKDVNHVISDTYLTQHGQSKVNLDHSGYIPKLTWTTVATLRCRFLVQNNIEGCMILNVLRFGVETVKLYSLSL